MNLPSFPKNPSIFPENHRNPVPILASTSNKEYGLSPSAVQKIKTLGVIFMKNITSLSHHWK
jgi:hypothetical protein